MFADVDESIRQLLIQHGNLDSGEVDIAFDMPTREWAARLTRPTVNLYLFDIRENTELRNPNAWVVRRGPSNSATKSRPVIKVDLSYKITAFANAIEDEHRLLSRVLLTLFVYPILPEEILQGAVIGQEMRAETAQPDGIVESPADYWGALDNDIKPSIDYRLTVAMDLNQEIEVGLALTSQVKLGHKVNGRSSEEINEMPLQIGGRIHSVDNIDEGISGVNVTLLERGLDTITDDEGRYGFGGVLPGSYTLVVSAPGMDERRQTIEVPGDSYDVGL